MPERFSIRDLPEVKDESKKYFVSGKTLKVIFGLLGRLWQGDNIAVAGGLTKSGDSVTGLSLFAKAAMRGGSSAANPWAPAISNEGTEEAPQWGVSVSHGHLFDEFGFGLLEIANLTDSITVVDTSVVFLQGEYDVDGPISSDPYTLEVATNPTMDADWEVEFDIETGPPDITYQKYWRVPICKVTASDGALVISQVYAFNHLQITRLLWQGKSAIIPQTRK